MVNLRFSCCLALVIAGRKSLIKIFAVGAQEGDVGGKFKQAKYVRQVYTGGEKCDLTGGMRQTEVSLTRTLNAL